MENFKGYRRPASVVVTLPDPDHAYAGIHTEIGGTLEIRCESPSHPTFKVLFEKGNPSNQESVYEFEGSIDRPLVLPILYEGDYEYTVLHFPKHGGRPIRATNDVHSIPCKGCTGGTHI